MSVDITRNYDSFVGPPSERISIPKFIHDTAPPAFPSGADVLDHAGWQGLTEDERAAVQAECSGGVSELKATVEEVWNNPLLSAHLYRTHAAAVSTNHSQAGGPVSKSRKRKHLPDPKVVEAQPEVRTLQEKLDAISLRCWGLNQESAFFMRASKHTDFNALKTVKKSGRGVLACNQSSPDLTESNSGPSSAGRSLHRDALITLTLYNRVPWIHSQLTRFSQHVLLSSQTLADFVRIIPCDSSDMPTEVMDDKRNVVGYTYESKGGCLETTQEGCLLLIEGVVYGDGRPGDDYADKLLSHVQGLPEDKRPQITKSPTSLSQTPFASLTLRINQPYWMLHQGNCEHFVVVDQIRLAHPLDPLSGYPLTVHITPTIGDNCKACSKVPAVFSIVGDIRLGESPCLLCSPCWRNMGPPSEDVEQVLVVPLVRRRAVWDGGMDV